MKSILTLFIILVVSFNLSGQDVIPIDQRYYQVTATSLVLREKPSRQARQMGLIYQNQILKKISSFSQMDEVAGKSGQWIQVQDLDEKKGYVFDAYVKPAIWEMDYHQTESKKGMIQCYQDCFKNQDVSSIFTQSKLQLILYDLAGKNMIFKHKLPVNVDDTEVLYYEPVHIFYDNRFVILDGNLYEGSRTYLIDRKTRTKLQLFDHPDISPDPNLLYVLSSGEAFTQNGIQLIALKGKPELVFELRTNWPPVRFSFQDQDTVVFYRAHQDYEKKGNLNTLYSQMIIKRENGVWKLLK